MSIVQQSPSATASATVGELWPLSCTTWYRNRIHPISSPAQLGICGYHVAGSGEYVLSVERGSEAARVGLKHGDLILALNGCQLSDENTWDRAINQTAGGDGAMSLLIHDGQTGSIRCRRCTVFSPPWVE